MNARFAVNRGQGWQTKARASCWGKLPRVGLLLPRITPLSKYIPGNTILNATESDQDSKIEDALEERSAIESLLYPDPEELPSDFEMPIWDHLEELRERVLAGALAAAVAVLICFACSKDLVVFLEAPVADQGVRFLQLSPGEFFFTTLKVGGYSGILLAAPTVLYEIIAYVVPGLTASERKFLAPVVFGSSILFYLGYVRIWSCMCVAACILNF